MNRASLKWLIRVSAFVLITVFVLTNGISLANPGGKILFHSARTGDWEIYTMNADGSNLRQLTSHPTIGGHSGLASFSPDMSKIAFLFGYGDWQELRVMDSYATDTDNQNSTLLFTDDWKNISPPQWLPNGSKIVFSAGYGFDWDVYMINSDGSNPNPTPTPIVAECGLDAALDVSPDGILLLASGKDNNCATEAGGVYLYTMDLNDSDPVPQPLLYNGEKVQGAWAYWSPDGTKIMFDRIAESGADWLVYTINYYGNSDVTDLNLIKEGAFSRTWSPDGNELLINITADGYTYKINSAGSGDPTLLPNNPLEATDWRNPYYTISGFYAPINNIPTTNIAKAGQPILIKWKLTDLNGTPISDPASFVSITSYINGSCGVRGDVVKEYSNASGLQYMGDGYWQFNWKTPKNYAGQCRTMTLTLRDSTTLDAYFRFK